MLYSIYTRAGQLLACHLTEHEVSDELGMILSEDPEALLNVVEE